MNVGDEVILSPSSSLRPHITGRAVIHSVHHGNTGRAYYVTTTDGKHYYALPVEVTPVPALTLLAEAAND